VKLLRRLRRSDSRFHEGVEAEAGFDGIVISALADAADADADADADAAEPNRVVRLRGAMVPTSVVALLATDCLTLLRLCIGSMHRATRGEGRAFSFRT
jgi:hypothetical protein